MHNGQPASPNGHASLPSYNAHFSADRPIQSITQDLLSRGEFASAFANALSSWRGTDSLVLAVYGTWGSGKTSVKNLILEFLTKAPRPLGVVEFNPWPWFGQDAIVPAFLTEIGLAIGHEAKGEERTQFVQKWRKYASRLALGGVVAKYTKAAAGLAGVPIVPTLLDIAGDAAEKAKTLLDSAAEASAAGGEESLDRIKASLADSLRHLDRPLLIVMDDMDRLTNEEIRLLFRLVKANADFPNVIFLLLFDRAIVEAALGNAAGGDGRAYMEKIVQAGFDLPEISQEDVDTAFTSGLETLLSAFPRWKERFNSDQWARMFSQCVRPFLGTMRDVRRLLSSLSFVVGLFHRDGGFEVNLVDLVGIEILRVFEPDVHRCIPGLQSTLIRTVQWSIPDPKNERAKRIDALVGRASARNNDVVRRMLEQLFPAIRTGFDPGFDGRWLRELRVCSAELFARYFVLSIPKEDIPQSLIDRVVSASADAEDIRELLGELHQKGRLIAVLKRLEAYVPVLDLSLAENFIVALWDVGDDLPDRGTGVFDLGPVAGSRRIVFQWLMRSQDKKWRGVTLLNALKRTVGLRLPIEQVGTEEQRNGKQGHEAILDDGDLKEAVQLSLEKIENAAKSNRIIGRKLGSYLWQWSRWSNSGAARKYAEALAASAENALVLLRGFVQEIRMTSLGYSVTRSTWEMRLKDIEPFVSADLLKEILSPVLTDAVPPEFLHLKKEFELEIDAFRQALERKAKGKPDEFDSYGDSDEET